MSVNARLERIEEILVGAANNPDATMREFSEWLRTEATPEEDAAFDRLWFNSVSPTDDELRRAGVTRDEREQRRAEVGPVREGDEALEARLLLRLPTDLEARCLASGVFCKPIDRQLAAEVAKGPA